MINSKVVSVILSSILLLSSGCFPSYYGRSQLPKDLVDELDKVEKYYLLNASKKAAFLANCPLKQTRPVITTTKQKKLILSSKDSRGIYVGETISSIGVTACEKKFVYQILCGLEEHYTAPLHEPSFSRAPCKIIAEGSDAAQAAEVDNQEMQHHADEQRRKHEQHERGKQHKRDKQTKERERQQQMYRGY